MILCDHQIQKALDDGLLIIRPTPHPSQIDSTSVDLHVGDDFKTWREGLRAPGVTPIIDLDNIKIAELESLTEAIEPVHGVVRIEPGAFVLVRTLEEVSLPIASRLAARVEGRSTQARLGMGVHITAPTVHAGFSGRITLEILNHGPFTLQVTPNQTILCQLIIERVGARPRRGIQTAFIGQATPLGTPRKRKGKP